MLHQISRESNFPIIWSSQRTFPQVLKSLARLCPAWKKTVRVKAENGTTKRFGGFTFAVNLITAFDVADGDILEIDCASIIAAKFHKFGSMDIMVADSLSPGKKYKGTLSHVASRDPHIYFDPPSGWGNGKNIFFDEEPIGWRTGNESNRHALRDVSHLKELVNKYNKHKYLNATATEIVTFEGYRKVEKSVILKDADGNEFYLDAKRFAFVSKNYPGGCWETSSNGVVAKFFDAENTFRAMLAKQNPENLGEIIGRKEIG